jgi:DNA-binding transcriptional LysR family regulator
MELRHLRYFVLVAEELHFGRAARRAGIAQPPLSQQIKALEAELGVDLFFRTKRRVEFTDAGRALLPEARRTLAQAARAEEIARSGALGMTGRLTLGFVGTAAFGVLVDFLRGFGEQYPNVLLDLREMPSEEQRRALREEAIDAGFVRYPVVDSDLESHLLFREPLALALPVEHPLADENEPIGADRLATDPWIVFPRSLGPPFFDQIVGLARDAGFTPRVAQEAVQMVTVVSLVSAGLGIAIVPGSMRRMPRQGVVYRALQAADGSMPAVGAWFIHRAGNRSPVLFNARRVVEAVAGRYQASA